MFRVRANVPGFSSVPLRSSRLGNLFLYIRVLPLGGKAAFRPCRDPSGLRQSQPMELAFVALIVGFVAGYGVRAAISHYRRAKARQDRRIAH